MMGRSLDSDTSFADNRPSTACLQPPNIFDATYKQSALRRVNAFLSARNFPFSLSLKPLPSARDIAETLKFILSRLDFHSAKLDDDLPALLKLLNCPHKINRSALKAPGTPHAFPYVLAVIHWLVQIADYEDEISFSDSSEGEGRSLHDGFDAITDHALRCYSHFMRGEDDATEELKSEFLMKIDREKVAVEENLQAGDREVVDLEARIEKLRSGPSPLQELEAVKEELAKDAMKLRDFVGKLSDGIEIMQKAVEDRERELNEALDEKERIFKENEDLKRKVKDQDIDLWAADRMKRELQAVEREIKEAESARSEGEHELWSLDEEIRRQFKALEALAIKSNLALKRLKLGSDLQYTLNSEGSTVEEVLGIDYKSIIKQAINSFSNEIKRRSKEISEELLVLQMQKVQINNKADEKKAHIAELQHSIEEMEAVLNSMDMEMLEKESRCKSEAENMLKDVEAQAQNLDIQHTEAKETLKAAELRLREMEKQSKNETEKCAYELFALIDSVSKHKEYMERKIHEMGKELSETSDSLPKVYKWNFSPKSSSFAGLPQRQTPDSKGR